MAIISQYIFLYYQLYWLIIAIYLSILSIVLANNSHYIFSYYQLFGLYGLHSHCYCMLYYFQLHGIYRQIHFHFITIFHIISISRSHQSTNNKNKLIKHKPINTSTTSNSTLIKTFLHVKQPHQNHKIFFIRNCV